MAERTMHLILAKVNLDANLWINSIDQGIAFLMKYLLDMNGREFSLGRSQDSWALSEVTMCTVEPGRMVLAGKLGRRIKTKRTEFNGVFVAKEADDWTACNFIFEPSTEYLLFEERKPGVSKRQFIAALEDLCKQSEEQHGFVTINLKVDKRKALERLKRVDAIYSAEIRYHIPNPAVRDVYRLLLADLELHRAERGKRVYESRAGLNLPDNFLTAALEMSADGYANYRFAVQEDGHVTSITSSKDAITTTIDASDEAAQFAARFYTELGRLKGKSADGD